MFTSKANKEEARVLAGLLDEWESRNEKYIALKTQADDARSRAAEQLEEFSTALCWVEHGIAVGDVVEWQQPVGYGWDKKHQRRRLLVTRVEASVQRETIGLRGCRVLSNGSFGSFETVTIPTMDVSLADITVSQINIGDVHPGNFNRLIDQATKGKAKAISILEKNGIQCDRLKGSE